MGDAVMRDGTADTSLSALGNTFAGPSQKPECPESQIEHTLSARQSPSSSHTTHK